MTEADAPVRNALKLGALRLTVVHEVRLGKRQIRFLRRNRQREASAARLTSGIGAYDIKAEHSRALRCSRDPHRAVLGNLQVQALRQRAVRRNRIHIRRGAAGGGLDCPDVFAMSGRNGQPACVERQVLPLGYGHLGPIGLDGRHRAQIRLRDAAIVRTRIRRRGASQTSAKQMFRPQAPRPRRHPRTRGTTGSPARATPRPRTRPPRGQGLPRRHRPQPKALPLRPHARWRPAAGPSPRAGPRERTRTPAFCGASISFKVTR